MIDVALLSTAAFGIWQANGFINNAQVAVIMNIAVMGVDLGKYAGPKMDGRFQGIRTWK